MFLLIVCFALLATHDCIIFRSRSNQDPELYMNAEETIKFYGYPCEVHHVTTKDRYILTLHRIPHGLRPSKIKPKPVALLQHGLLDSSFTFVNNGPKKSLGFIMADRGFDVWLGNVRGNTYSNSHETYSNTSRNYWNFSWNDMAKYDLPAMIDYVLSVSKAKKLGYIGHSQGTQIGFAEFSENPDLNQKVSAFVALTPVAYLGNVRSAIRFLAGLGNTLNFVMNIVGTGEFLPSKDLISSMSSFLCGGKLTSVVCGNVAFMLQGFNVDNTNFSRVAIYAKHFPAGTSWKNMAHYTQSYLSGRFQKFDYGIFKNWKVYHQYKPPVYHLERITVPTAMFWGGNDLLAVPKDVERTIHDLGETVKLKKYIPEYNHLDFIWGKNADEKVFPDIMTFLLKYAK